MREGEVPEDPKRVEDLPRKEEVTAELQENLAELSKSLSFDDVAKILGSTVKHDRTSKIILLSSMLLTYTEEEQVNVLMAAESASGKSYLPIELSAYFPEQDLAILGGASPQSFFHEVSGGDFATWDPEKKQSRVNLANKILIFLDQPHDQLLQRLRPFLSHDRKEIKYKISDRSQKAGLRTKTVILIGFSTVVFCTAKFDLDQQERTRVFQLSPETTTQKVDAALDLLLEKKSDRDAFREQLLSNNDRKFLIRRIEDIKNASLRDVVIPGALKQSIKKAWKDLHPHSIPRHTRDLDRFLSLVKASALLNWRSRRPVANNRVEAQQTDVDEALGVYAEIAESNELGIAPQVYEIYKEVIQPLGIAKGADGQPVAVGISRRAIGKEYHRLYHRNLQDTRLRREILPSLDASGLISEEPDPNDRRQNLVYPQVPAPISSARGLLLGNNEAPRNRGQEVGVNETLENPPLHHPDVLRSAPVDKPLPDETRTVLEAVKKLFITGRYQFVTAALLSYETKLPVPLVETSFQLLQSEGHLVNDPQHIDHWRPNNAHADSREGP